MKLNLNDTFNKELPFDKNESNEVRIVKEACFSYTLPTPCQDPFLLHVSTEMLHELGISIEESQSNDFLQIYSGNKIYPNTQPFAMCYGGHQFGHWAGQLGDGRAINLFEINHNNQQWAVQLKGVGKTPYSRSADGMAVLRSSIREYLCSEAMHHLGVPTTRALSLILSGNEVLRDILYNGNATFEKGAIVARVAPSFIRFGNFQILSSRNDTNTLKKLVDYTIKHFFSYLGSPSKETYFKWFEEIAERTLEMVVHWERVGFVHGVMNTDNMSILGLTIDYGPYGWLENYDPNWTPNTTDATHHRYRFEAQGQIAIWNLYQLANALVPIIDDIPLLEKSLKNIQQNLASKQKVMMLSKLGLRNETSNSDILIQNLKKLLYQSEMDMTIFFRMLSTFEEKNISQFTQSLSQYSYSNNFSSHLPDWNSWFHSYAEALTNDCLEDYKIKMNQVNPKYVLRNYMAQMAIEKANEGDYNLIDELYQLLKKPYDEQLQMEKYFVKRPEWALNKVGCSQLSCSS